MVGLILGVQLTAFSLSPSAAPDADIAAATAVGLAVAGCQTVEVPASVEVANTEPPAMAGPQYPENRRIEWVPTCDEHGCRLVPRILSSETPSGTTGYSAFSRPYRGIRSRLRGR